MSELDVSWWALGVCHYDSYKVGPIFTWLSDKDGTLHQAHQWTRCREIFGRYLQGFIRQEEMERYGEIAWTKLQPDPIIDPLTMGVRLGSMDTKKSLTFGDNLGNLVWPIEEQMGLVETVLLPATPAEGDEGRSWVIRADPFWMKAPALLSCYLLLLRATPYSPATGSLKKKLTRTLGKGYETGRGQKDGPLIMHLVALGTEGWAANPIDYYDSYLFNKCGLDYFSKLDKDTRAKYMATGNTSPLSSVG